MLHFLTALIKHRALSSSSVDLQQLTFEVTRKLLRKRLLKVKPSESYNLRSLSKDIKVYIITHINRVYMGSGAIVRELYSYGENRYFKILKKIRLIHSFNPYTCYQFLIYFLHQKKLYVIICKKVPIYCQ